MGWLYSIILILGSNGFFNAPAKYVSRTGHIHIKSTNRLMDIEADNFQVYCILDPSTGEVSLNGLMKSFEFKLGALDRAYNSDRINLGPYSKFSYSGILNNYKSINFDKPGTYDASVIGTLQIGGFTRKTDARGRIFVAANGTIRTETSFILTIEEKSMQTINQLMREKLPSIVSVDTKKLGVSRNIQLKLIAEYRAR